MWVSRQPEGPVRLGWNAWWRDGGIWVTAAALGAVAAAAWVAVVRQAADMQAMQAMQAGQLGSTARIADALGFVGGWGVMMAAMMLPSALPMIALYGTVSRSMSGSSRRLLPVTLFAATYLVVWLLLGVPVYAATTLVAAGASASPTVTHLLPYALALVLLAAGGYQFSAIKRVCLKQCQSPLSFLMSHWRPGYGGALRVGLAHAAYCVGCCWGLMAVLAAAGAMGLHWVLLIAVIVFAEKLLSRSKWTTAAVGVALMFLGLLVAVQPGFAATLRGQGM